VAAPSRRLPEVQTSRTTLTAAIAALAHTSVETSTHHSLRALSTRPKGKRVPPGLDAYRGELHLCPPVKTGFVHIYKSAGSAVGKAFRRLCDLRHGANTSVLVHQKLTTLPLHDYKFFTFIRNPDQRFLSGVFECHRRRNLPASDLGGDPIDGTVLRHTPPAVFLRSVVARSLDVGYTTESTRARIPASQFKPASALQPLSHKCSSNSLSSSCPPVGSPSPRTAAQRALGATGLELGVGG